MQILADDNIPAVLVDALREAGHDVVWIRTDAPGLDDPSILARATEERRILLTFDLDFAALTFGDRLSAIAGIVLLRFPSRGPGVLVSRVVEALEEGGEWEGHLTLIEAGRVRRRPVP